MQESGFLPFAAGASLAVRRDLLADGIGFDPTLPSGEDIDLCWRLQLQGIPLVFVPEAVLHYRHRTTVGGVYRQAWGYGVAGPRLFRKYRALGMRRRSAKATIRFWGALAARLLHVRSRRDLAHYVGLVGYPGARRLLVAPRPRRHRQLPVVHDTVGRAGRHGAPIGRRAGRAASRERSVIAAIKPPSTLRGPCTRPLRPAVPAGDGSTIAEAEVWQLRLGGEMYDTWRLALGEHGTQLYGRVRSSPDPTRSSFEISVGENAMAVTPGEVVELIHELLDRASSGSR